MMTCKQDMTKVTHGPVQFLLGVIVGNCGEKEMSRSDWTKAVEKSAHSSID